MAAKGSEEGMPQLARTLHSAALNSSRERLSLVPAHTKRCVREWTRRAGRWGGSGSGLDQ